MPKTSWKGNITVGLMNIPITLQNASVDKKKEMGGKFHNITPCCSSRVKQFQKCIKCGKEMNSKEVLKGYEIGKNEYVVMTQDERNSVRV